VDRGGCVWVVGSSVILGGWGLGGAETLPGGGRPKEKSILEAQAVKMGLERGSSILVGREGLQQREHIKRTTIFPHCR